MKKYFLILASLTAFLFSCQKEITLENETTSPPTPLPSDTALLIKNFIVLDTTLVSPNDTIYRYTFLYDSFERCTSFSGSDGVDSFAVFNFYNGNDTLITKRKIYDYSAGDSIIHFLTYSPNGKILSDSIREYIGSTTTFFIDYSNTSNQNGTITVKSNGSQFEYNNFITTRDLNNNLLNVKDSLFVLSGANYSLTETTNSSITYDTKINPFYKIVPTFLVNALIETSSIFTFTPFQSLPQKNNIISENRISNPSTSGLGDVNNIFRYTYNSSNYPTVVWGTDNLNKTYFKGIYIYY